MKQIIRILICLTIAASFAYTYYDNKLEAPEKITNSINDFELMTTTMPTALEESLLTIEVFISGPIDSTMNFQFRNSKSLQDENTLLRLYARTPLTRPDSSGQAFSTRLRSPQKGAAVYYYFEILDPIGRHIADLKMHEDKPFKILGVGKVPGWITYSQLTLLFIALFSLALAAMLAAECEDNNARTGQSVRWLVVSLVSFIPGVYLFETLSRIHQFGESWQAVPFGTNFSDNLIQILIIFILLIILSSKNLMGRTELISRPLYRILTKIALALSFFAFVMSDALVLSASLTTLFSYSILSLMILSFAVFFYKAKNS